ncbi:MAG: DNA-packaging protein [Hyphomonadaceae bacterium]|nr:DNA-packaging protein [Hyphomonadaceae bacterium]
MTKSFARTWSVASLASSAPTELKTFLESLTGAELRLLNRDWEFWAHDAQLPPPGPWRTWVFLGGRGAGKTEAGAAWVKRIVRAGQAGRVALVAPTFNDAREVMIEGPAGLRAGAGERPAIEPTRRRVVWENGAEAHFFSAEDPESLRGPQFDAAWGDEFCYWAQPEATLGALLHGLRLGEAPKLALTTTPRPLAALKRLLGASDTVRTLASTWANAHNLAPDFLAALRARWTGSVHDRQELAGALIEDPAGALWTRELIESVRAPSLPGLDRILVAVDPPVSIGKASNACGIVAAGAYGGEADRRAIVLADASLQGARPEEWASAAARLARSLNAEAIVAEANNGGELVRAMLKLVAGDTAVRLVNARVSKHERALPVSALYIRGRVSHASVFAELEDEMCSFGAPGFIGSPDRLDALVWAITELLVKDVRPRLRPL